MLAVLDGGEDRRDGVLDRAGHLEQHVDVRLVATSIGSSVTAGAPGLDGAGERRGRVADRRVVLAASA